MKELVILLILTLITQHFNKNFKDAKLTNVIENFTDKTIIFYFHFLI